MIEISEDRQDNTDVPDIVEVTVPPESAGARLDAFLAGAVAVGAIVYDLLQLPFDHTSNAYGSLYYTLTIFAAVILLGGLAQNLFTQIWAWAGRYSAREHIAVDIGALYWYAAIAFWAALGGTVYLSPYVV